MARAKAVANTGKALAYLRTSSAQNVGGDSDQRQREAITRFAHAQGYELAGEFYDAAVSGADPIESRPGFAAMLERIEGNGVRVVIVEDASRFARSVRPGAGCACHAGPWSSGIDRQRRGPDQHR
jgi:DNA invertase Pin-like site-specific DNA recombinase